MCTVVHAEDLTTFFFPDFDGAKFETMQFAPSGLRTRRVATTPTGYVNILLAGDRFIGTDELTNNPAGYHEVAHAGEQMFVYDYKVEPAGSRNVIGTEMYSPPRWINSAMDNCKSGESSCMPVTIVTSNIRYRSGNAQEGYTFDITRTFTRVDGTHAVFKLTSSIGLRPCEHIQQTCLVMVENNGPFGTETEYCAINPLNPGELFILKENSKDVGAPTGSHDHSSDVRV